MAEGSTSGDGAGEGMVSESTGAVSNDNGLGNQPTETTEAKKPDYRTDFRSRFKDEGDDFDTDDDESFYPKAIEKLDGLKKFKTENTAINKKMIDTLNSNPEAAGLFRDLMKGASLSEAIARNVDMDSITPMEGDPDYDSWTKNLETRKKTMAEREAYAKEVETNSQMTAKEIVAFAEENGLDEEGATNFLQSIDEIVSNAIKGRLTKETMGKIYRAMNADMEVAQAKEQATVETRNQKIEAQKEKDFTPKAGDGLPRMEATNKEKAPVETPSDPWSRAIDEQIARRNK